MIDQVYRGLAQFHMQTFLVQYSKTGPAEPVLYVQTWMFEIEKKMPEL